MFDFLKSVTDCKDKKVAADLWRFAVVQPPPFETQLLETERSNAMELALDRSSIHSGHGYAAGGAETFGFAFDLDGPAVTR